MRTAPCAIALAAGCAAQEIPATAAVSEWDVVDRAASRLGSFRNRLVAVSGLAELAHVTCLHDRRRAASMLFQAFEILKKADTAGIHFPAPPALLRSSEECAPEIAAVILRERPRFEQSFADQVQNARSAIGSEDESRTTALLERAAPELPYVTVEQMVAFTDVLLELRRESAEEGDRAFTATLEALLADRTVALQALFAIGNYVFGPSARSEHDIESREAGSGTAFRLAFDRPSSTEASAVAYFEAAAAVLDASKRDEPKLDADLLSQLPPHARRLAPDVAEDLAVIARKLGLADASAEAEPAALSSAAEKEILARFRLHWVTGRVHTARELITGLFGQPARQQMDTLADFAEARQALETKRPDLATAVSAAMAGGTHKTLVHLGLAAYAVSQKDSEGARDFAFLSLREALTAPPAHRPGLQIIAVRVLSKADPEAAFGTLSQAVDSLNAIDAAPPRESTRVRLTRWGFSENVGLGRERRSFALALPGLPPPDLCAAAADLATIDAARTEDILFRLRSERRLAEALVTLAARTLQRAPSR